MSEFSDLVKYKVVWTPNKLWSLILLLSQFIVRKMWFLLRNNNNFLLWLEYVFRKLCENSKLNITKNRCFCILSFAAQIPWRAEIWRKSSNMTKGKKILLLDDTVLKEIYYIGKFFSTKTLRLVWLTKTCIARFFYRVIKGIKKAFTFCFHAHKITDKIEAGRGVGKCHVCVSLKTLRSCFCINCCEIVVQYTAGAI